MPSFDLSSGSAILVGIFVGILSTSVQSLGLTLQRKSHLLEDERVTQRPPYRRRWQVRWTLCINEAHIHTLRWAYSVGNLYENEKIASHVPAHQVFLLTPLLLVGF